MKVMTCSLRLDNLTTDANGLFCLKYLYIEKKIRQCTDLLSFPGCCCMSSSLYFLAKSMNPFIGLFGLSGSFSLGVLGALVVVGVAGEAGGDPDPEPYTMLFLMATGLTKVVVEDAAASEAEGVVGSGTVSEPAAVPAAGSENWNRRNRSLKSGVLTTSA